MPSATPSAKRSSRPSSSYAPNIRQRHRRQAGHHAEGHRAHRGHHGRQHLPRRTAAASALLPAPRPAMGRLPHAAPRLLLRRRGRTSRRRRHGRGRQDGGARSAEGLAVGAMTNSDILIIGAGLNGLVAAAYLAKAGKKVLVLERRAIAGGQAGGRKSFGEASRCDGAACRRPAAPGHRRAISTSRGTDLPTAPSSEPYDFGAAGRRPAATDGRVRTT